MNRSEIRRAARDATAALAMICGICAVLSVIVAVLALAVATRNPVAFVVIGLGCMWVLLFASEVSL